MEIKLVSDDGEILRLKVASKIIRYDPAPPQDPLVRIGGRDFYKRIVLLDLAESDFVDSSGLSWLLVAHKRFCEANGKLILHSVSPGVSETIKMMRLELVLNLARDESQALELARKAEQ